MNKSLSLRLVIGIASLGVALLASAQNIVKDGDIESANVGFYDANASIDGFWTARGAQAAIVGPSSTVGQPISGGRSVLLNLGGVDQSLFTLPNQEYLLSMDVYAPTPVDLTLGFGDSTVGLSLPGSTEVGHYDLTETATSASTLLSVRVNSFATFDNISVQAVPEPTTLAAFGLGAFAVLRRRKRG